jgi:hypothetical protein
LIGGAIGGIANGIYTRQRGGNFWTGNGAIFESVATTPIDGNQIRIGEGMEYSNSYAQQFSDKHYGENVAGVRNLYADGSIPPTSGYTVDGDLILNSAGKQVLGATAYYVDKGSDVYLFKQAFVAKEQLFLTMGHEYMHAFFFTFPNYLSHDLQHNATWIWEYQQAKIFTYNLHYYNYHYLKTISNMPLIYDYKFPFMPKFIKF